METRSREDGVGKKGGGQITVGLIFYPSANRKLDFKQEFTLALTGTARNAGKLICVEEGIYPKVGMRDEGCL